MINVGDSIPEVYFNFRQDDDWQSLNTRESFAGKRVLIFALPGAFTPTCSSQQLPGYEELYNDFQEAGIDEVYCLSVNDTFVMNAWFENQGIKNVKALPDGNFEFTSRVDALVEKGNLGFGKRSWRYAMVVNDNVVEHVFAEDDMRDLADTDPYEVSAPENVLRALTDSE
jgi:peroxiredoxin